MLKTRRREVVTLSIGPWIARETIWRNPTTGQRSGSTDLRRLVAPGCTYGYDVVEEVGRKLFLEAQSVRQIIQLLKQSHVLLSPSTVADLGRRFIVLLALAHRRCTHRLRQAISLRGGYILHLDATYEDKSPMLMTGFDAVMDIVLGNIKLPSEKAEGIVPFLRRLKECFGPPLALVHDMSKGILSAVEEVFPGIPDFICHFHFLRDTGKDLLGADYDRLRQRLQTHGTMGRLRARLRAWRLQIRADPPLKKALDQLPSGGWPTEPLEQAPLLAAYLLAQWILAGLQQGCGYGFPFDRPLLVLAQRAQEAYAQLQSLLSENQSGDWRCRLPLHHLAGELKPLVHDYPLKHNLSRLETYGQIFDQLRQALRMAPVKGEGGLNRPRRARGNEDSAAASSSLCRARPRPPRLRHHTRPAGDDRANRALRCQVVCRPADRVHAPGSPHHPTPADQQCNGALVPGLETQLPPQNRLPLPGPKLAHDVTGHPAGEESAKPRVSQDPLGWPTLTGRLIRSDRPSQRS